MQFNETFKKVVNADLNSNGLIPMLVGEPGIGKSSWVIDLARLNHTKCFVLACNQLADKADLTGARLVPDGNGGYKQVFYPHAAIADAIQYAIDHPRENPILFMDEINRTTPDVTSACLSLSTTRTIGSQELPENLKIIVAGNDKGNINTLDEASIARFAPYSVVPDVPTFLSLDDELNPFIKNVLTAHPECIFCKTVNTLIGAESDDDDSEDFNTTIEEILDEGDGMNQLTTPRTISGLSKWLNEFTNQELMEMLAETHSKNGEDMSLLQEIIEAHVGHTNFTLFLLAEIANNVMSTDNQVAVRTIGKPACYDDFKACNDMTELEEFIQNNMDTNDMSGCMIYLLYEKEDNSAYIKALANHMDKLISDDLKTLMALSSSSKLDAENVNALLSGKSALSMSLSIILESNI